MTISTLRVVVDGPAEVDTTRRRPSRRARPSRGRDPIDAATSPGVVPASTTLVEPSGSVIVICRLIYFALVKAYGRGEGTSGRGAAGLFRVADDAVSARRRAARGRCRAARRAPSAPSGADVSLATGEDRAREVVERVERARRVEVVVDRGAHAFGERPRIGSGRRRGRGEQAVQQRGCPLRDRCRTTRTRGGSDAGSARGGSRADRLVFNRSLTNTRLPSDFDIFSPS